MFKIKKKRCTYAMNSIYRSNMKTTRRRVLTENLDFSDQHAINRQILFTTKLGRSFQTFFTETGKCFLILGTHLSREILNKIQNKTYTNINRPSTLQISLQCGLTDERLFRLLGTVLFWASEPLVSATSDILVFRCVLAIKAFQQN